MGFDRFQGAELIRESLERLVELDLQLIICGSGDREYEKYFQEFAAAHPDHVAVLTDYADTLLHLMIAGLDILLMPGRIEACGMLQLFAMSYGTIPVAYAGGGIVETIDEVSGESGSGFLFRDYSADAFIGKLLEAVACFDDDERWQPLVLEAMGRDFAWKSSAEEYDQLYRKLLGE